MSLRDAILDLHVVPKIPLREDADPYVIWLAASESMRQAVIELLDDPNHPNPELAEKIDQEFR